MMEEEEAVAYLQRVARMAGEDIAAYAAAHGRVEDLQRLIKDSHIWVPLATDNVGTPLVVVACAAGFPECAELLLQHGADANRPSRSLGATALALACANGHLECVELLLRRRVARSCVWRGRTPAQWAAHFGHVVCMQRVEPSAPTPAPVAQPPSASDISADCLETHLRSFNSTTHR
jgi:ankyrin repeat protein